MTPAVRSAEPRSLDAGTPGDWPPKGLRVRGRGTLRFMGLPVYDAELAAAGAFDPARFSDASLALRLQYHRNLPGEGIVERSLAEMRRAGPLDKAQEQAWTAFMSEAFADVRRGDRIVGHWEPREGRSSFRHNDGPLRSLDDAAFGPRFFGIWLAPTTSEPRLREALLGAAG